MTTPLTFDTVAAESDSSGARVLSFGPRTPMTFESVDAEAEGMYYGRVDDHIYIGFRAVDAEFGGTLEMFEHAVLMFDSVDISADVSGPRFRGRLAMTFDSVDAEAGAYQGYLPDFSNNPPIQMAIVLTGTMKIFPPAGS